MLHGSYDLIDRSMAFDLLCSVDCRRRLLLLLFNNSYHTTDGNQVVHSPFTMDNNVCNEIGYQAIKNSKLRLNKPIEYGVKEEKKK